MFGVAEVEARVVRVPLKSPMKLANAEIADAENLIVRVRDRDGNVGWGEAASAPTMTGETPESMVAAVRFMEPALIGVDIADPLDLRLDRLMHGNDGAKAAIEIAVLDLAGKRLGKPLHELLGGKARDEAVVLTMVAGGDRRAEVESARRQLEAGFAAFKVKVGVNDPLRDLERAAAVRAVGGAGARISADANQGYGREDAVRFAEGAAGAGIDFMEQLVAAGDIEGMAACAAASGVPLGADEGLRSVRDIRLHRETGAASGGSLKTIKFGGVGPVLRASRLMRDLGMHVNLAGKLAETGIASAAIAHLAVAVPQLDWDVSVTSQYLVDDVVEDSIRIVDGRLRPGDGPGLGVVPAEEKLAKFLRSL